MKEISASMNQIRNVPGGLDSTRGMPNAKGSPGSTEFKDQLQALRNVMPETAAPTAAGAPRAANALKFSNHAVERMQARGVRFSPEEMGRIESAVSKAESKGAKNTLLLTDAAAMIVSIKDKTVVTVMDKSNLKENVFTNIDSTVMV